MKRIPMTYLAGLFVPVLVASLAWADTAADLKQADEHYQAGRYTEAETAYQSVLNQADPNKPEDTERAFNARKKLPVVYLATDRAAQAQTAVQNLLVRHSDHERLPHAVHEIVEQAKELDRTLQAGQIYQNLLAAQPQQPQTLWLKMGVAISNVYLHNDEAVEAGVQDIVARHGDEQWAAEALAQTGWAYDKLKQYHKSRPLYEYVVDHWADRPRAIHAHTALVRACIFLKDEEAAEARLDQLVQRYADDKDLPSVLSQIGRNYREAGMYEESKQVSRYILDNHAGDDHCIWAQRDIVLCDLASGDLEAAAGSTQVLLSTFAEHNGAVWAISDIAESYGKLGRHEQARELFQFNLDHCPQRDHSIWSLRGFITESVALQDNASIEAGIEKLFGEYAASKNLPMAALHIGRELCTAGHPRAAELFQHIVNKHPDHEQAIFARVCLGHVHVRQGQDNEAEAIYQKVLSDYAGDPRLPKAVHLMAEGYYERALTERKQALEADSAEDMLKAMADGPPEVAVQHFQKAMAHWGLIINQLPERPDTTAAAYHFTGACYECMRQYDKAIPCYQALVERWPDYEYAWHVQYLIGHIYEYLKESEAVPASEADPRIQAAYEQLVARYPNCRTAVAARSWLRLHAEAQQGGEK